MSESITEPTILVPFDASETGDVPSALVELLSPHQLVVLGYYPVPDQTATDQARAQFGEEATERVDGIAERFAGSGAGAESVLVFTHDRSRTIESVASDYDVDAILTPGHVIDSLNRILVPLRGEGNLERILGFVGVLLHESDATVTMFNVVESDEEASRGELLVRGACDRLTEDEGIDPARTDWRVDREGSPSTTISKASEAYDLLIVGETEPSLADRILGNVTDGLMNKSPDSLLIVRTK
jgi:nucleotide-binding universal stress UspA family protein